MARYRVTITLGSVFFHSWHPEVEEVIEVGDPLEASNVVRDVAARIRRKFEAKGYRVEVREPRVGRVLIIEGDVVTNDAGYMPGHGEYALIELDAIESDA